MNQPDERPTFKQWVKAQNKATRKRIIKEAKTRAIKNIKQGIRNFFKSSRFDFVCYFWLFLLIITLIIIGLSISFID